MRYIFLSGCRELNPGRIHPKDVYYRYTTARCLLKVYRLSKKFNKKIAPTLEQFLLKNLFFRFTHFFYTSRACQNSLAVCQPSFLQIGIFSKPIYRIIISAKLFSGSPHLRTFSTNFTSFHFIKFICF